MIYTVIYTNGKHGYKCYDTSRGFPKDYIEKIEEIGSRISDFEGDTSTGVRFSPLGEKYLLSVIFRGITSEDEARVHHLAVNFLMDGADADELMLIPYHLADKMFTALSERIAITREIPVPDGFTVSEMMGKIQKRSATASVDADLAGSLLMGALCADPAYNGSYQVFLACTEPAKKLEWLLLRLPLSTRKLVSFHTNVRSASDSQQVTLSLCTADSLDRMSGENFAGGERSDKLKFYESAPEINRSSKDPLCALFHRITREQVTAITKLMGESESFSELRVLLAVFLGEYSEETLSALVSTLGDERSAKALEGGLLPKAFSDMMLSRKWSPKTHPSLSAISAKKPARSKAKGKKAKTADSEKNNAKENDMKPSANKTRFLIAALVCVLICVVFAAAIMLVVKQALIVMIDPSGTISIVLSASSAKYLFLVALSSVLSGGLCLALKSFWDRFMK